MSLYRTNDGVSRRALLKTGGWLVSGMVFPSALIGRAFADDMPAMGTWPEGSTGSIRSPSARRCRAPAPMPCRARTNSRACSSPSSTSTAGHELIKKIAPKITKGVLGKEVKLVVADSAAKPNTAVQEQQTFINDNKIVAMSGSTSSAVAVALNKFAQREKILYLVAHLRLERHHRQGLRALFLPPVLLWRDRGERDRPGAGQGLRQGQEGGVHDAGLHLRPHRHEVGERLSDRERRLDAGDRPGVAARHAGFQPVSDQHRQLRRRRHHQRQLGPRRGAVGPAGQAVRPDAEDEDGDPLPDPVPRQGSGRRN